MGLKDFFNSVFGAKSSSGSSQSLNSIAISNLIGVDAGQISLVLKRPDKYYTKFKMSKRRGGYRTISAPKQPLSTIQQKIYQQLLNGGLVHSAAKGFCKNISVAHNAQVHLGKKNILKVDIQSFFGSIQIQKVISVFELMGHSLELSEQLAQLCCLNGRLPQGASTSPALSNMVVYEMDTHLEKLAAQHNLCYSRYADDLTFSGEFAKEDILPKVKKIIEQEGFSLNTKKTQYLAAKQRKIITGVSISSGSKLTIPKAKKRELRKNIHFVLTRGVDVHKAHIKSTDPLYVQRIIGYLSFWLSVEPENAYVKKSIKALQAISSK